MAVKLRPSVNSRLNNLIKILPEFAIIERNQQVVMDLTRGVAAVAATIVEGHRSGCYTLDDAAC